MSNYNVKFNKKAHDGKSKAEFIEAEKHHAELGVDLASEYDKMFPDGQPAKPKSKDKTE